MVAGTNYMVKISTGSSQDHCHCKIFQPLPHTGEKPRLMVAKGGFTESDELKVLE